MSVARATLRTLLLLLIVALILPPTLAVRLAAVVGGPLLERFGLRAGVWFQTLWARASLAALGIELDVEGRPPPGQYVVVSNHPSYLDILVLASLFPGRFVAKSEIAGWPLFGVLARSVATIFIERGRSRDVVRAAERMRRSLAAGLGVTVFPEGGATRGAEVERFHPALFESAARLGLGCLPVALSYSTPGEPWAPAYTVCWWGGMPLLPHLGRFLRLRRVCARVRWAAAPLTGSDRKRLAERSRVAVERVFDPVPQHPPSPDPWVRKLVESPGGSGSGAASQVGGVPEL